MLRLVIIILSIIGLYVICHPPLNLAPLPAFPANVNLRVQSGVLPEDQETVTRAISLTCAIWEKEYGLKLDRPVKLTIVSDQFSYLQHLLHEEHLPASVAYFQTGHSSGVTHADHIIINARSAKDYDELLFITAHEISHLYQLQINPQCTRLTWVIEGMADVLAARVVAENTGRMEKTADYQQKWLSLLGALNKHPPLTDLDTRQDWLRSLAAYGEVPTYRTSALAVAALVKQTGYSPLKQLLQELCTREPEAAFASVYGKPPIDFYDEFEQLLADK